MKYIAIVLLCLGLCGCGYYPDSYRLPKGLKLQHIGDGESAKDYAIWIFLDEIPYKYFSINNNQGEGNAAEHISVEDLRKILFLKKSSNVLEDLLSHLKICEDDGQYYLDKDLVKFINTETGTVRYYLPKK